LLRVVLIANLVAQIGIVVTGGLVRLTGSGLGCPTWPQCVPGSYTPVVNQPQGIHKEIEFGNRLLTFVVSTLALAALAVVLQHVRTTRKRRDPQAMPSGRGLVLLAAVPLAGVLAQAVLGGVTVITGLHPAWVAAHFLVSAGLIAGSTLLLIEALRWEASPSPSQDTERPRSEVRWLAIAVGVVAAAVIMLGTVVTGSGPHSGDAAAPARFGFDPRTVSWLHADTVWLFVGLVLALVLALRLTGAAQRAQRWSVALLVVTLGQGLVGYVQYATDLPIGLVSLHMLGACLLVVAVTGSLHAVLRRPS
jgi:heme a synthase